MRSRLGEKGTPRLKASQVTSILKRHGFLLAGQSGSHQKWRNPATGKQVIVAQHATKVLPLGTMRSIIAGSGIALDEWRD
ncbi:MAG: type II toxin-antitoxin system HicA family toxin [Bryobacteraceae bacterium]